MYTYQYFKLRLDVFDEWDSWRWETSRFAAEEASSHVPEICVAGRVCGKCVDVVCKETLPGQSACYRHIQLRHCSHRNYKNRERIPNENDPSCFGRDFYRRPSCLHTSLSSPDNANIHSITLSHTSCSLVNFISFQVRYGEYS